MTFTPIHDPRIVQHAPSRSGRTNTAPRPERVTLGRISLGQPPSLLCLRRRTPGLVRQIPRYYEAV